MSWPSTVVVESRRRTLYILSVNLKQGCQETVYRDETDTWIICQKQKEYLDTVFVPKRNSWNEDETRETKRKTNDTKSNRFS